MPYKPLRYTGVNPAFVQMSLPIQKAHSSSEPQYPYGATSEAGTSQSHGRSRRRERVC